MKTKQVIDALGALAHEYRLRAYRLLVEAGTDGLNAGTIAQRLGLAPSSLTFHLQGLQRAGLISQTRDSRQLIYAADFEAISRKIAVAARVARRLVRRRGAPSERSRNHPSPFDGGSS
jgi:ArsR family transcriptional regulator, arsenate/arsenite/antimonite-responsive transcriptional repressor